MRTHRDMFPDFREPESDCDPAFRWRPGKLWSLLEIIMEFDLHKFLGLLNALRTITVMARTATEEQKAAPGSDITFVRLLGEDVQRLAKMRLPASRNALLDLQSSIKYHGPYNDLADQKAGIVSRTLYYELEGRKFLQIENEDLYSKGAQLFGSEVAAKFASDGAFEIDEAGKCLALGRSTASVFHLMRVMEVGIKVSSACLGIPDPVKAGDRNWGNMLRKFKTEMDRRNAVSPAQWQTASDRDFFDEIYVSLDAVRNVWRNPTMHVENKYVPEEADHILGAVRGFMRKLASRCDEQGQPPA